MFMRKKIYHFLVHIHIISVVKITWRFQRPP